MNNVGGLLEGVGCAGWRGAKGENQDNYSSIINKIQFKNIQLLYLKKRI